MANPIIKAARDRDLYMEWSTNANGPTFVGTRAEVLVHLDLAGRQPGDSPELRLQRADATGTSAKPDPGTPGDKPIGTWEDTGLIVEQRGWLPRSKFGEFMQACARDDETAAYGLLEPFQD